MSAHARRRRVAALRAAETERRKKRKHVMRWALVERGNEAHFAHVQARHDRDAVAAMEVKAERDRAAARQGAGLLERTIALSAAHTVADDAASILSDGAGGHRCLGSECLGSEVS